MDLILMNRVHVGDKFKKIFSKTKGKTEPHLRGLVIGETKWVVISL